MGASSIANAEEWRPLAVVKTAEYIDFAPEVKNRLLDDLRMKRVWDVLFKREVTEEQIAKADKNRRLPSYEELDFIPSRFGETEDGEFYEVSSEIRRASWRSAVACGIYFYEATLSIAKQRAIVERSLIQKMVEDYRRAHESCLRLRSDVGMTFAVMEALSTSADAFQERANMYEQMLPTNRYVDDASPRKTLQRLIAIEMLENTNTLFGSCLKNTVRTTINVGMGFKDKGDVDAISKDDIDNWRKYVGGSAN